MRRKEQRSMLALAIMMAFVIGVFCAGPVYAGNFEPPEDKGYECRLPDICDKLDSIVEKLGAPAAVEKTGQTEPDATGDDGDLEKGVVWPNPRFTDNDDGTVTDNLTGLIWLKNANRFGSLAWAAALTACNTLTEDGVNLKDGSVAGDWRLPNVKELQSLIHFGFAGPALPNTAGTGQWSDDDPFTGVQLSIYWSATTYAHNTDSAWYVYLGDGSVNTATSPAAATMSGRFEVDNRMI